MSLDHIYVIDKSFINLDQVSYNTLFFGTYIFFKKITSLGMIHIECANGKKRFDRTSMIILWKDVFFYKVISMSNLLQ